MAKLDRSEPYDWAGALRGAYDETVRLPLWEFPPEAVPFVLRERRRRFGITEEFDPEYH
ncbi:hypothetical protein TG1_26 [Streptomyces phage TG1]|uniref:Uncharacterized protein n=1 Tax=Streptomyces phage TG1 TaxID=2927987 RepID=K4HYJ9_9CAUD|nr:hypothetical protein D281_gp26 [Streptomyces phage TG1]AFU62221.1 hypothetical protein TG1_26 [Streptomyces phage TG1]